MSPFLHAHRMCVRALRTFFQNVHCTSQQIAVTLLRWLSHSPSGSPESLPGPPPSPATKFTPGHLEGPLRPCSNSEDGISTGEMVLVAFGSILHIMCVCVCVCVCVCMEKGMAIPFLPGEFHGQRSLVGYSLWDHKVRHD